MLKKAISGNFSHGLTVDSVLRLIQLPLLQWIRLACAIAQEIKKLE